MMMDDRERERLLQSFSAWLAMEEYLGDMRLRNCSHRTVREYEKVLIAYFLDTGDYSLDVARSVLRAWVARMYERGLKPSTVATRVGVLRGFFRFAFKEGLASEDRSVHLPKVKVGQQLPKALSVSEVQALMAAIAEAKTPRGARDLVLFTVMYSCGLRVSEVVGLLVENVDLEGRMIRVLGKGNRERRVYLKGQVVDLLRAWIGERERGWLFPGQREGEHLSARVVQTYARQYGEAAGLGGKVHPHALRHSCATHYLTNGAPITFVQALLGHAKLSTTGMYTQLADEECARVTEEVALAVG